MTASRIKLTAPVNATDDTVNRVQKRILDMLRGIIASPVLDTQILTIPLQNSGAVQTVNFTHQLGRPAKLVWVVGCTVLIAQFGNTTTPTPTTGTIDLLISNPVAGATVTLAVS
jgi:hypothetical protein